MKLKKEMGKSESKGEKEVGLPHPPLISYIYSTSNSPFSVLVFFFKSNKIKVRREKSMMMMHMNN